VKRARRALATLAFMLLGACLMRQVHADASAAVPIACEPALEIDGHLHCGAVGRWALLRTCGPEWAAVSSGDAVRTASGCVHAGRMQGSELAALGVPVDVNNAALAELESLPGIGPVLARRIAGSRPFRGVDDLRRVDGIGPVRMAALRQRARVTGLAVDVAAPVVTRSVSLVSP
jgi:hypothetical protein